MLKRFLSDLAARAGYEVLGKWRLPSLGIATKTAELFKLYDIDAVIDVGANEGQYRDFLRLEVGFKGQIYSFEPLPRLAAHLARRATEDPKWTVFPCALGASAGTAQINEMRSTVFTSFLLPSPNMDRHLVGMNEVGAVHTVPVETLSGIASQLSDLSRTYLKLDTQGFDLEVVKGGKDIIQEKIPALQTEVSFRPIYGGMPSYIEAIKTFNQLGFDVSDFFHVSNDKYLRAIEFDCLMVKPQGDYRPQARSPA